MAVAGACAASTSSHASPAASTNAASRVPPKSSTAKGTFGEGAGEGQRDSDEDPADAHALAARQRRGPPGRQVAFIDLDAVDAREHGQHESAVVPGDPGMLA